MSQPDGLRETAQSGGIFPLVAADVLAHFHEKDRTYFRESREERLGTTLEASLDERPSRLPVFQKGLAPLRAALEVERTRQWIEEGGLTRSEIPASLLPHTHGLVRDSIT